MKRLYQFLNSKFLTYSFFVNTDFKFFKWKKIEENKKELHLDFELLLFDEFVSLVPENFY